MSRSLIIATILVLLCDCGGGNGGPVFLGGGGGGGVVQTGGFGGAMTATDPNMLAVTVDQGPPGISPPYTNGLFATVRLCEPGTTTCQTIDHLLVDTGSVGVRVLESELTLSLPAVTSASGLALAECLPFVDSTAWGPVAVADVTLGQETAVNLPVQLIGEGTYSIPSDCTGTPVNDMQSLGAKGNLGVGVNLQDCGAACAQPGTSRLNPGWYYACASTGACAITAAPLLDQVAHPVAGFPDDNNGTIIQLPSIPASGAPSAPGLLVFGIGTQGNNGLGSAAVLALDRNGFLTTTFPVRGTGYVSFVDSGSNGLFFLDAKTTNLSQCTGGLKDFYCPGSTTNLGATLSSIDGASATIAFSVANASRLSGQAYAFTDLAGPMPGFPTDTTMPGFDWGLPFFFGRAVYTAIEDQGTPAGVGPYVAF